MGAAKVGKSSLITQFLYSRFNAKYKRTIEEMHQGNFNVAGVGLTLDILDTSGTNEVTTHYIALCRAGKKHPRVGDVDLRFEGQSI